MSRIQVVFGNLKRCGSCLSLKQLDDFPKNIKSKSGLYCYCKECANLKNKDNYSRHRSKVLTRQAAYAKTLKGRLVASKAYAKQKLLYPEKIKARERLNVALRYNRIQKMPCFCGSTKVEAHHEDYSKPLDVIWFCRTHHWQHEGRLVEALNSLPPPKVN